MAASKASNVQLIRDIVVFTVIAVGLGIGSAYLAINNSHGLGLYQIGPWKAWPKASGPKADPYAQANQARTGAMLIGSAEGISFVATSDDAGTPLEGACQYRIRGDHLPARLWTISVQDASGTLIDNPSGRYSYHNHEVARVSGTRYEVVTGPEALGGNWLMSPQNGPFQLVLRLYETPLTSGGDYSQVKLPAIEWMDCR